MPSVRRKGRERIDLALLFCKVKDCDRALLTPHEAKYGKCRYCLSRLSPNAANFGKTFHKYGHGVLLARGKGIKVVRSKSKAKKERVFKVRGITVVQHVPKALKTFTPKIERQTETTDLFDKDGSVITYLPTKGSSWEEIEAKHQLTSQAETA